MSRSKDWRQYPTHYRGVLTFMGKVGNEHKQIVIPFDTETAANNFRLDFNSFKTAIIADPATRGMYGVAIEVMVQVRKAEVGATVLITNRNYSDFSIAVAKALVAADPKWAQEAGVEVPQKPEQVSLRQAMVGEGDA